MTSYFINILIGGVIYLSLVFFVIKLIKFKLNTGKPGKRNNGDDDGGIEFYSEPDLDLPPGVTLPEGGPGKKWYKDEKEDVLI